MPATADHITVALRFDRADAPKLQAIAEITGEDRGAFARAAESAAAGDPLILKATTRQEIEHLADRIQTYGIQRPAIDHLTDPQAERRS